MEIYENEIPECKLWDNIPQKKPFANRILFASLFCHLFMKYKKIIHPT